MKNVGELLISDAAYEEVETLYLRIQNPTAARRAWSMLFSAEDREQLGGNLPRAYDSNGVVGMWMRLRGANEGRAIVELAHALGFVADALRNRLLQELGQLIESPLPETVPTWNPERRELSLGGLVIRRVLQPLIACNVIAILDRFEEMGWPPRIDDPLPGGRDQMRLHKTIAHLNRGLLRIRFHGDGTGAGLSWREAANGLRSG